jgi:class 3 adenylate cyclase
VENTGTANHAKYTKTPFWKFVSRVWRFSRLETGQFQGREIKTIGDSFMAAFKCAGAALDYARALPGHTGHPQVQIRAGIHIGPMHVEEGDVFGGTVNFAARVVGAVEV